MALFDQMEVILDLRGAVIKSYYYRDMEGVFEIPGEYAGEPVISIDDKAFCDCKFVKVMTIPNTVECIGANSFANCAFIELFVSSRLRRIHKTSFCGCHNLETILWGDDKCDDNDDMDIIVDCDDHQEIIKRGELLDYIRQNNRREMLEEI